MTWVCFLLGHDYIRLNIRDFLLFVLFISFGFPLFLSSLSPYHLNSPKILQEKKIKRLNVNLIQILCADSGHDVIIPKEVRLVVRVLF
jgi:hypothetical protein